MKTGWLAYLAAVCVAAFLGGCGGGGDDGDGNGGESSIAPPSAPFSLEVTAGDRQVTLTWSEQVADRYNLCHAREPILDIDNCGIYADGTMVLNVQGPPLIVSNLVNGQRYYFRLESVAGTSRNVSRQAEAVPVAVTILNSRDLYIVDDQGTLGLVNPDTGNVKVVGPTGASLTEIAFHPSGDLYGISFSSIYKINKNTASTQLIGSHQVPGGNSLVFSEDGTLYAAGSESTNLFELNPRNGATTNLGNIGYFAAGDLAFFKGSLFLSSSTGELIIIDLKDLSRTVPVGGLGRFDSLGLSEVFGLAPGDDGSVSGGDGGFYGAGGTDVFKIDTLTGALSDTTSYSGQGLNIAFGMATTKPPLFPIAGYSGDPGSRVTACFAAYGVDDGSKFSYVGAGQFHAGVDLGFVASTKVQAPTSGTLSYYRQPLAGNIMMNTFFVLEGDDGRSYLFAHVDCDSSVCDAAQATRRDEDTYAVDSQKRVARGQVLGTIGVMDAVHLHFGVVTGSMVNEDGKLRPEFHSAGWARILYGTDQIADVEGARKHARALGFIDPMSLYVSPTGCESLHSGVTGLMGSAVTIAVEVAGDFSDGPYDATVGPGVEFDLGPGRTGRTVRTRVDVSDDRIVFDYSRAGSGFFATSSFNGYVIELDTDGLTWELVTLDPETTLQLDPSRVSFDENVLRINVSGLRYSSSSTIVLNVVAKRQ